MKTTQSAQGAAREELEFAWNAREKSGELKRLEALRVFHGPGESDSDLRGLAIDRYGSHAWITEWEGLSGSQARSLRPLLSEFLKSKGLESAVALWRPDPGKGIPDEPEVLFGKVPAEPFVVQEGALKFQIRLREVRHPGLFLDHEPLRRWLVDRVKDQRVLNLFAYTGSLSVACGQGGASQVTTLDLSKPTIEWASENWALNGLAKESSDFIFGDSFEWLSKFAKKGKHFDCVILDPPSFSRDKKGGTFSTSKDLGRLHEGVLSVLAPGGMIVTSINSANVFVEKYEMDIKAAALRAGRTFSVLHRFDLPETFPTRLGESIQQRYLKGFILRERV